MEEQRTLRKTYYYLFDGLGSIVGVTKGDGTKENSYDCGPYGNMLHQTEGITNLWKFAGGFLDSSTGLDTCRIGCEKNVFACQ